MVQTRSKNHVTTPALVVSLSLAGFVATPPEPEDLRAAEGMACPWCGGSPVRVRAYERGAGPSYRYRLILSCPCGWMEEA
jgi:hypothetical protein